MNYSRISTETKKKIKKMRLDGVSFYSIAKDLKIGKSTVRYWANEKYRADAIKKSAVAKKENPDLMRKTRLNRKIRAMGMVGGVKCGECGCDEIDFLEFNHIYGGGAKDLKSGGHGMTDRLLSGKRSIEGLNVLCRVCNALDYLSRKNPSSAKKYHIKYD